MCYFSLTECHKFFNKHHKFFNKHHNFFNKNHNFLTDCYVICIFQPINNHYIETTDYITILHPMHPINPISLHSYTTNLYLYNATPHIYPIRITITQPLHATNCGEREIIPLFSRPGRRKCFCNILSESRFFRHF